MRLRPRLRPVSVPVMFIVGAVLGAAWDQLHVQAGTLRYTDKTLAGQAWWVPLEFGLVYALGLPLFIKLGDPAPRESTMRLLGLELVWATGCYAASAFFDDTPWLVFGILAVAALSRAGALLVFLEGNLIPIAALVVLGPITESMLVSSGVFSYTLRQLGPIPAWLPLLYLNIAPFAVRAAEAALKVFGVRRVAEAA